MMKQSTVAALLVVLVVNDLETFVLSFSPGRFARPRPSFAIVGADDSEEVKKETLTFNADIEVISDTIPSDFTEEFVQFFSQKECRDLFLSAGGTRTMTELPMDDADDLISLWKESCKHWGSAMLPEDDDTLVEVEISVRFPGLTLVTRTCSGVKTLINEDGTLDYNMVLIGEKKEPRGPAAIVWIFDQLTGNANKPKDRYSIPSAKALAKVSLVDKEGSCAVKYSIDFRIDVEFPRVLLRILPFSKEKMEEQGSSSVRRTITKDVLQALDAVRSHFHHNQSVAESALLS